MTIFLVLFSTLRTMTYAYSLWPSSHEVQFVWQSAFAQIGQNLDQSVENGLENGANVVVAGWSPDSLDFPSMQLAMRSENEAILRHVGGVGAIETLVFPQDKFLFYRPTALPLHPHLDQLLHEAELGLDRSMDGDIEIIKGDAVGPKALPDLNQIGVKLQHPIETNQSLTLIGYQMLDNEPGELALLTYWQVNGALVAEAKNVRSFLHLVDHEGQLLAQHDGLDAPARFWQDGDHLVQVHTLPFDENGEALRIGLYLGGSPPNSRYDTPDGQGFLTISLNR